VPAEIEHGGLDALALGLLHSCASKDGKGVSCWGANGMSQCEVPEEMKKGVNVRGVDAMAAGGSHTCAARNRSGLFKCWGFNQFGQADAPMEYRDTE